MVVCKYAVPNKVSDPQWTVMKEFTIYLKEVEAFPGKAHRIWRGMCSCWSCPAPVLTPALSQWWTAWCQTPSRTHQMPAEGFWHSLAHSESRNRYRKQYDNNREHGTWIKQADLLTFVLWKDNRKLWKFSGFLQLLLTISDDRLEKWLLIKCVKCCTWFKLFLSQERSSLSHCFDEQVRSC